MNDQYARTANTAGKKERLSSAALALVLGLALLLPCTAAMAYDPLTDGLLLIRKNSGGIPIILPIDASGKFSLRLQEAGNYTISTACRQPSGCLPHKLSAELKPGAGGEPSIIAILVGLLLPAQKASVDGTTFDFTVGDRGVVLSGQFQDAAGVRVAAGDINQDGVEAGKAAPKKAAGKPGIAGGLTGDNTWTGPIKGEKQAGGGEVKPGITGGTYLEIKLEDVLVSSKIAENNSPLPQNRGTAPHLGGGDGKLQPIDDVEVKLGKNPGGSIVASSKTDNQGNFHFDKLPAENYIITFAGQLSQSLTVGPDGIARGKLMRGPDGSMSIFDRWGNRTATFPKAGGGKTAGNPITGFGSGNTTMGTGTGIGTGPGMGPGMSPAAGPAVGGPMSPGMGGGPKGPGGAMGGPGAGKP